MGLFECSTSGLTNFRVLFYLRCNAILFCHSFDGNCVFCSCALRERLEREKREERQRRKKRNEREEHCVAMQFSPVSLLSHLPRTTGGEDQISNNLPKSQQVVTGFSVNFNRVFTGVPKFSKRFSRRKQKSPSFHANSTRSGDANISSLISPVDGVRCNAIYVYI